MILQSLYRYYERKKEDLPQVGFQEAEIHFIIEIDTQGVPIQIVDTREGEGKRKRAKSFFVPEEIKRTSNIEANLLWDKCEYLLGIGQKNPKRLANMKDAFVERIKKLPEHLHEDDGIRAVIKFYEQYANGNLDLEKFEEWKQIEERKISPHATFRLRGDLGLICQRPVVSGFLQSGEFDDGSRVGICLVTGQKKKIKRLHLAITNMKGTQSTLVSANTDERRAFGSFNKEQGYNSPVGKDVFSGYRNALNHLLSRDSRQRVQVGDTSMVFWAEKPTDLEVQAPDIFGEPPKDDPDRNTRAVESLYKAIDRGLLERDEGKTKFFVLGLVPNEGRIAVRFWQHGTVAEMTLRIKRHFDDLDIERGQQGPPSPYLPLYSDKGKWKEWALLNSIAVRGEVDNIPPNLGGELIRSIFAGLPYPHTLLSAAVRRIRAEQAKKDPKTGRPVQNVTYPRAALIKACINRAVRYSNAEKKEELRMSLDETNSNVGYRLGRLFAVLEKAQKDALGVISANIRDRYYGSASSTPGIVFPTLLKLNNHHLSKLESKRETRSWAESQKKRIGEIMEGLHNFPAQLTLKDQGRFAIGYYHQRQDFFKKSEPTLSEGA